MNNDADYSLKNRAQRARPSRLVMAAFASVLAAASAAVFLLADRVIAVQSVDHDTGESASRGDVPNGIATSTEEGKNPSGNTARAKLAPINASVSSASQLNIAADFSRLAQLAHDGDVNAAQILYQALEGCSRAPNDPIDGDRRSRAIAESSEFSETTKKVLIDADQQLLDRCGRFTSSQRGRRAEFLRLAAQAGDNVARREFFFERPRRAPGDPTSFIASEEHRRTAQKFLQDAIESGDVDALVLMSDGYSTEYFRDSSALPTAYAYRMAFLRAGAPMPEFGKASQVRMLAAWEERMTAQEIESARIRAEQLVQCCVRPRR